MTYTAEMRKSIEKVAATRPARVEQRFRPMTPDEKQAVLREYHPDYVESGMRPIRVGPNQGGRAPNELVDVLEAPPVLTPDALDVTQPDITADVLVIGGGGAGASAALLAQENGAAVLLATKLRFGDANTMMAQGGIQAADRPEDSPVTHYLDVIGGGHFTNLPELVRALVLDAPDVVRWLELLGCMFDKQPDGTMMEEHGGGTSRKRMHSARDYTGAEIMRTLRDEVRNRERITVMEFAPVIELLLDENGRAAGAVLQNLETGQRLVVHSKAVIIATGGGGRLHYQGFPTTNHHGATADGLVLAYRVGAPLAFIDTMQYHPTGAAFPEQIVGLLVTEKVRGLGADVVNAAGEQFVYPLETRDVEAAAFIRECRRGHGVVTLSGQPGVWLDSPIIDLIHGPGTIERALPAMHRQFMRFGIDMAQDPILVYPTLHYQNGGILIQDDGSTQVEGLYVAGEAAGGIHGRNRLMGNSLLDILVFGRRSGRAAALYAQSAKPGARTLDHLAAWAQMRAGAGLDGARPAPVLLPDYARHV
ncbi:MAG: FAD-binding protein [Anaerolineae bacterium]|nr:FAD-binding protein [Anaerolineae bacterium]